jgi:hypothetical protein
MADVRPHHVLAASDVRLSFLDVSTGNGQPSSRSVLTGWTVASAVSVRAELESELDDAAVLEALGLSGGRILRSIVWRSTGTRTGGLLCIAEGCSGMLEGTVAPPVDGRLALSVSLSVEDCDPVDPFAPTLDGMVVWETRETYFLSGSASRFPVSTLDFLEAGLPRGALWRIDVDLSEPEADSSSSLSLYLNSGHSRYPELVRAGRSDLLTVLEWDIRRHVVERAVDEDVDLSAAFPVGSVGSFARQCCLVALGTEDVDEVRRLRESDRSRFETDIRGATLVLAAR